MAMKEWKPWMHNASQLNDKIINMLLTLYLDQDSLKLNSWERGFVQDNIVRLERYTNRFTYTAKQEQKIKDIYFNNVNEVFDEALWEGMVEAQKHLEQMRRESPPIKELPIPGERVSGGEFDDDIPF